MENSNGFVNHKNNESVWISWFFLGLNLGAAFLISKVESYSLWFLIWLLIDMVLAIVWARKINGTVLTISRLLLGLLFIYSGFVKGVDPLGTQFKIEDYFYAYGIAWAAPSALLLSVLLNATEFSIGALLFFRIKTKWVSWLAILMMLLFTITTLYDALYSPVPDCGCFGDALIISNWQTFYKNLVIDSFVLLILLRRFDFREYSSKILEWSSLAVIVIGFILFENYNINNLPIVDFRSWKVGNRLIPEHPLPVRYFLTYKNKKTGEEKEYLSKELPWQDSTFIADWKWLSSREEDPNVGEMNIFPMLDKQGNDVSKEIAKDTNFVFIFSIYDIDKVPPKIVPVLNQFYHDAVSKGYEVVVLNSNLPEDYQRFKKTYSLADFPVLNSDDTALKAAVRSNPGLIVIKSGKVIAKYHYTNFPSLNALIKKFDD